MFLAYVKIKNFTPAPRNIRIKKNYKFGVKDWLQNEEEGEGIFIFQIYDLSVIFLNRHATKLWPARFFLT